MLQSLFVGENKSQKSLFFCICKQQETRFATNGSDFQQMLNGFTFVPRVIGIFDFLHQYLIWLTFMMYICHIMILMGEHGMVFKIWEFFIHTAMVGTELQCENQMLLCKDKQKQQQDLRFSK